MEVSMSAHIHVRTVIFYSSPFYYQDFLSCNPLELMSILGYSYPQLQALTITVSKAVTPKPQTVGHPVTLHIYLVSHHHFCNARLTKYSPVTWLSSILGHSAQPLTLISQAFSEPSCIAVASCLFILQASDGGTLWMLHSALKLLSKLGMRLTLAVSCTGSLPT